MANSPPASPPPARPMSGVFQAGRSSSRMSISTKQGGGSRASDEDSKTSVKVGMCNNVFDSGYGRIRNSLLTVRQ